LLTTQEGKLTVNNKSNAIEGGPPPASESWWAAVLEEVESTPLPDTHKDPDQLEETNGDDAILNSQLINWIQAKELFGQDLVITLEVTGHNRGGLLVNGDALQGFVPASHLVGLSRKCSDDEREPILESYVGRSLRLKVIECDPERGRIVFSERAAQADPGRRNELLQDLEEGDCVEGRVTTITDFGVFVDLGGVEGLIHISELSWGRVRHPSDVISPDQETQVYILSLDREKIRVALSLKRLHPNPWDSVETRYTQGQIADAVITSVVSFGAFARLEDGLDGLIHVSELGEGATDPRKLFQEGQSVKVRILHIDPARQRLGLRLYNDGDGMV
jgi:small subunit ribosomal protein S1